MKKNKPMCEIGYIRAIRKQFRFDDFTLQLLLHYTRIPLETLKIRHLRARDDTSKLLIQLAVDYKEAQIKKAEGFCVAPPIQERENIERS